MPERREQEAELPFRLTCSWLVGCWLVVLFRLFFFHFWSKQIFCWHLTRISFKELLNWNINKKKSIQNEKLLNTTLSVKDKQFFTWKKKKKLAWLSQCLCEAFIFLITYSECVRRTNTLLVLICSISVIAAFLSVLGFCVWATFAPKLQFKATMQLLAFSQVIRI